MPRKPSYDTVRQRVSLYHKMWELANIDVALFALVSPFSPEDKTPYKTRNSMVKKRPKKNGDSLMVKMVELKFDLKQALLQNDFEEALRCYFTLRHLVGF